MTADLSPAERATVDRIEQAPDALADVNLYLCRHGKYPFEHWCDDHADRECANQIGGAS